MRCLCDIPPDQWEKLRAVARANYRTPRQQLEMLVHQALAHAFEAEQPAPLVPQQPEVLHAEAE